MRLRLVSAMRHFNEVAQYRAATFQIVHRKTDPVAPLAFVVSQRFQPARLYFGFNVVGLW
jgi:hypothetical protein